MEFQQPIPTPAKLTLGVLAWILLLGIWQLIPTLNPAIETLLPSPTRSSMNSTASWWLDRAVLWSNRAARNQTKEPMNVPLKLPDDIVESTHGALATLSATTGSSFFFTTKSTKDTKGDSEDISLYAVFEFGDIQIEHEACLDA